ncbi:MAG: hypothetical protein ACR2KB_13640 [Chitinophagaceae bacterium]
MQTIGTLLFITAAVYFCYWLCTQRKNIKENYYPIATIAGFNLLSIQERKLLGLFNTVEGVTLWGLAVQQVCEKGNAYSFRKLIQQLREQSADSPEVMKNILGEEVFNALHELQD